MSNAAADFVILVICFMLLVLVALGLGTFLYLLLRNTWVERLYRRIEAYFWEVEE